MIIVFTKTKPINNLRNNIKNNKKNRIHPDTDMWNSKLNNLIVMARIYAALLSLKKPSKNHSPL